MRKLALAVILAIAPMTGFAEDAMIAMDTELGMTQDAVKAKLTEMGYEVRKVGTEDGMIEVYAVKGDQMLEVYVSPETGKVTKVSGED
ncbi:PepSY domain-containing protein [Paracoccus sp. (in: a-proteobacteria)]|uniref:PepSY domain-containing protein n=1 Tax=Paracoccus sp. TaxID=267 RepID=UPI003A8621FB